MNFFSTLIADMTAKQKGGMIALLGGLLLSGLGLTALSDGQLQIGPNGIDYNAKESLGRTTASLSQSQTNSSLES